MAPNSTRHIRVHRKISIKSNLLYRHMDRHWFRSTKMAVIVRCSILLHLQLASGAQCSFVSVEFLLGSFPCIFEG